MYAAMIMLKSIDKVPNAVLQTISYTGQYAILNCDDRFIRDDLYL